MQENNVKKEWKNPEITVLSVNEDTENGFNAGPDGLEQS